MSHTFAQKPAFGTLKENLYQSDYINRKKAKNTYCRTPSNCQKMATANSYDKINLYKLGRYSIGLDKCNAIHVNKGNLIMGQYTKLNLQNVCTIAVGPPPNQHCSNITPCNPCQNNALVQINTSLMAPPFYQNYTIDPLGELFGASQCNELNYTHYMSL